MSNLSELKSLHADFYKHKPPRWKYDYIFQAARFGAKMGRGYPHARLDEIADAVTDEMLFFQHGAPPASSVLKAVDEDRKKWSAR